MESQLEQEIRKLKTIDEINEAFDMLKYQRSLLTNLKLMELRVDDRVSFKWSDTILNGTITKINPKKIKVLTDHNCKFSVPALLLTKLENENE